MANAPADIAELQRALEVCCAELAEALAEEGVVPVGEGEGGAGGEGALGADGEPGAGDGLGPRWRPLVLAPLPGLDLLLSTIRPPLNVVIALLKVIAALLEALAAIMVGIADPLRALLAAVIALVRDIINDLLNTGVYMYADAPGITPTESSIEETGLFVDPEQDWIAGRKLQPPPVSPDSFQRWASRFTRSFDDPGDANRPIVTEGAPIQAVFLVVAAPSLQALRQLIYLIGKLLNIDQFKAALEKYRRASPDPRKTRLQEVSSVPPDWQAKRLVDLLPDLKDLAALPGMLLGLLASVDKIVGLIKDLAAAMQDKAQVLLDLADAIQGVLDLLEALKSSGIYALPVATTGGVDGLRDAFLRAADRPPGGYVGGVCFLASGPNLAKATLLWQLLGLSTAMDLIEGELTPDELWDQLKQSSTAQLIEDNYDQVGDEVEAALETAQAEGKKLASVMEQAADAFQDAIAGSPDALFEELGVGRDQLEELVAGNRALGVDLLVQAERTWPYHDEAIARGIADTRLAQRRGARSLALGLGEVPAAAPTPADDGAGAPEGPPGPGEDGGEAP